VLLALSFWLAEGALRLALVVLAFAFAGLYLVDTPKAMLVRRVQHRRMAVLDLLTTVATTVVAVTLAARGAGLWALLATDLVTLLLAVVAYYGWRPVWRPRLRWAGDTVRYYLRFGSRTMAESALSEALDNLDDLWIGANLGTQALGYYSRAYTFATYPRRLLAMPVNAVAGGAYAELKGQRPRLSQAFFRSNALLIRSGFLLGGLLVLVAPEFTRLALGERWLPMVPAFRLLAIFTLLDPIRVTVSSLFVAAGQPEQVVRTRLVQLAALLVGLFALGSRWGITGVALVVDGVLLIGLGWLLARARAHVDFSLRRLFLAPGVALAAGVAAALSAVWLACNVAPTTCGNDWVSGGLKALAFVAVFATTLLGLERDDARRMLAQWREARREAAEHPETAEAESAQIV
jgi:O-antigen/teichoic acid export membrane protein